MQFLVERLDRSWGFSLQVGLLAGWLAGEDSTTRIHTTSYDRECFPSLEASVTETSSPGSSLGNSEPTLVGPYPATNRAAGTSLETYSVVLPDLPWDLYPKKRKRWLGEPPSYSEGGGGLFLRALSAPFRYPWRKTSTAWKRRRDRAGVTGAETVYIYDDRLRKPVKDFYDVEPELINPVAAVGPGKSTDPESTIIASGPYEPLHNFKRIIDAFYLFVNRLGTQRRQDWDGRTPTQLWTSGDFTLKLHGRGSGEEYLREYAESQQLGDQVEFEGWIHTEDYDAEVSSSLAIVEVPLAGDASSLVYHGLSLGVPAVHTRHHRGLDTLLEGSNLSHKTSSTNADEIATKLLGAVQTPTSHRQPIDDLKKALSVESGAERLVNEVTSGD